MPGHDEYGKKVLAEATEGAVALYGPAVEVDYGAGQPARIDGAVGEIVAIEVESRVSKQVRGAMLDLISHRFPRKLLVLLPVHMSNPEITAEQCRNIFVRFCARDSFRVVVLEGTGEVPQLERDAKTVKAALAELGYEREN